MIVSMGKDLVDAEFILEDGVYKVGREVEKNVEV